MCLYFLPRYSIVKELNRDTKTPRNNQPEVLAAKCQYLGKSTTDVNKNLAEFRNFFFRDGQSRVITQ